MVAGALMAGEDWTDEEVQICVDAYFEHLKLDIAGENFNKAQLYRDLSISIPRSPSSIEFKFQNISAVLNELGTEWIRGLAPLPHFQSALAIAVEQRLPLFLKTTNAIEVRGFEDLAAIFLEAAPERVSRAKQLPDYLERLVRKFDPVERDLKNSSLGEAGEEFAFHFERRNLIGHQREDLARRVQWTSKEIGDGAGYDIRSFEPDGKEKFIEVKTTCGGNRTPFFVSRNENEFSNEAGSQFHLFRLYDFRRSPKAFEMIGALNQYVKLTAESFRADFDL